MKYKKIGMVLTLVICALALTACNSGPQFDECLVGIWEVDDIEAYALALLPPDAFAPGSLNFMQGSKELAYKFDENGGLSALAIQWQAVFDLAGVQSGQSLLGFQINGLANGEYQTEDGRVMVVKTLLGQINYQAVLDGELMQDSNQPQEFLPLFMPPANIAEYTCTEQTLSLHLLNRDDLERPLTFRRTE